MFGRILFYLKKQDWILTCIVILLVSVGLLAIYSTSFSSTGQNPDVFYKQLTFAIIGLIMLIGVSFIDYRFFRVYGNILYILGALFLVAVLIFGTEIRGTTGWIFIGDYGFQPVEFVKILLILILARYFSQTGRDFHKLKHYIISGSLALLYIVLVLLQPDFGSALVYLTLWLGLLFLLNVKRSYILAILVIILIVGSLGWNFTLKDYQKERISNFLYPNRDPLKTGYNITQSIVAVGSGQLWGRGLGLGPQSQLKFLPEHQTDFIYAVVAEELGFIGASLLLVLFGALFFRLIRLARQSSDDFSIFLTSGVLIMIFFQVVVNIGMNMGLAPVVGIPLPFISAGGSSLISSMISIGLIQGIVTHKTKSKLY